MRRTTATLLLLAILAVFGAGVATVIARRGGEGGTAAPTSTTAVPTTAPPKAAPTSAAVAPTTVAPTTVAPTTVAPTATAPTTVAPTATAPTTTATTATVPVTSTTTIAEHPMTGGGGAQAPAWVLLGLGALGLAGARQRRG